MSSSLQDCAFVEGLIELDEMEMQCRVATRVRVEGWDHGGLGLSRGE
mgnify:CR=1 FL=1